VFAKTIFFLFVYSHFSFNLFILCSLLNHLNLPKTYTLEGVKLDFKDPQELASTP